MFSSVIRHYTLVFLVIFMTSCRTTATEIKRWTMQIKPVCIILPTGNSDSVGQMKAVLIHHCLIFLHSYSFKKKILLSCCVFVSTIFLPIVFFKNLQLCILYIDNRLKVWRQPQIIAYILKICISFSHQIYKLPF